MNDITSLNHISSSRRTSKFFLLFKLIECRQAHSLELVFHSFSSDEPDDNNNLVPSWKLSTSKDDRFENSLTTLVNSDKNNDVNETNGNKNSSSTSVEASK